MHKKICLEWFTSATRTRGTSSSVICLVDVPHLAKTTTTMFPERKFPSKLLYPFPILPSPYQSRVPKIYSRGELPSPFRNARILRKWKTNTIPTDEILGPDFETFLALDGPVRKTHTIVDICSPNALVEKGTCSYPPHIPASKKRSIPLSQI